MNEKNRLKIEKTLEILKPQMKLALPEGMNADRIVRIVLTELRKSPKLLECDPLSVVGSVMLCAQVGLEIGATLGEAYLIPYGKECKFVLGYQGMLELARRSGKILSVAANCVYTNDEFIYEYGFNENLIHKPNLEDRGQFKAAYCLVKLLGGGIQFDVMSPKDIYICRDRSATKGKTGPWVSDFDLMARKSVIRRLFKYLPRSVEMKKAIAYEEALESNGNVIDLLKEDYNIEELQNDNIQNGNINKSQAEILAEKL
jgi:recombination protein RecT